MTKSKYLKQFEAAAGHIRLRGNRILVEPLPKEEIRTAGGLIMAAPETDHRSTLEQNRASLAVVLAVGEGYYNEDTGADVPMDIKVGNIVLINAYGMRPYSSFPSLRDYKQDGIAMIRDSDVNAVWENDEAFKLYAEKLNNDGAV